MPAASTREGSRRQHERAVVEVRVDVSPDATARFISSVSRNLSEGGMFVATEALLREGAEVGVGFMVEDGGEPVRGAARVVWVRPEPDGDERPAGAGLAIVSLESDGAERLAGWCGRLRDRQRAAIPPPVPVRPEVVGPAGEKNRAEVFDGTGVFLTRGTVASTMPRTDVFVVDDAIADGATVPGSVRGRRVGVFWIAAAVVVVALVAGALLSRDRIPGWLDRFAGPDDPSASGGPTPTDVDPAAGGVGDPYSPAGSRPVAAAAGGLPALRQVECRDQDGTSVVTIRLSAPIAAEQVAVDALHDPERALVRLVGVVAGGPDMAPTGTLGARVGAVRIGAHVELDPPELHVVLDLADAASGVVAWWAEGETVEMVVGAVELAAAPGTAD